MLEDQALVNTVAAQIVGHRGNSALEALNEAAELARMQGDDLSAETWLDIADAAELLLGSNKGRQKNL